MTTMCQYEIDTFHVVSWAPNVGFTKHNLWPTIYKVGGRWWWWICGQSVWWFCLPAIKRSNEPLSICWSSMSPRQHVEIIAIIGRYFSYRQSTYISLFEFAYTNYMRINNYFVIFTLEAPPDVQLLWERLGQSSSGCIAELGNFKAIASW